MAGDWIKMRVSLATDPAVIGMAISLDRSEFEVVGMLHHLWCWADAHSSDGHADGVTGKWINRFIQCDGFADSMVKVGWLQITDTGIVFPDFDRHNGQSAKARGLAATRKQKQRSTVTEQAGQLSRIERDKDVTREEKNREEKNRSNTPPPPAGEDGNGAPKEVEQDGHGSGQSGQMSHESDLPEGFETFWKTYPRKTAKANALKAWAKLKPNAELISKIMQSVAYHCLCADWLKDDGQYIPHPATWLNGKRWEDELRPVDNVHHLPARRGAIEPIDFDSTDWLERATDEMNQ